MRDCRWRSIPMAIAKSTWCWRHLQRRRKQIPVRMRVTASSLETDDAVAIAFETEDGALLRAEAGQFMTVHWPVDGRIEKRAYSLSSAVDGSVSMICSKLIIAGAA